MSVAEQEALLALCLLAAMADGGKNDAERAEFKRIAERLASPGLDTLKVYHDVLLKHTSLERAVAALSGPESRQLAYEMAVCVCDADDTLSVAEQEFLAGLRRALGLDTARAAQFEEQACALVVASVPPPLPPAVATAAAAAAAPPPGPPPSPRPRPRPRPRPPPLPSSMPRSSRRKERIRWS